VVQVEFAPIPARLIVHYKDTDGNTITTDYSPGGTYYVGDSVDCGLFDPVVVGSKAYRYDHSSKTVTTNGKCTVTATTTEVTHFYKAPAQLIVHYKDTAGNKIKDDVTTTGTYYVGDRVDCAKLSTIASSSTTPYLYKNSTPQTPDANGKCEVTALKTEVTHVYRIPAKMTIKYKSGDTEIKSPFVYDTDIYVDDELDCKLVQRIQYGTPTVHLYDYDSTDVTILTGNKCKVTSANTVVTHNYNIVKGDIIIHYKDVDTDEEISNPLTVTKPVNDKTTIKKKTITDYMFVGGPDGQEKTHTEATQNYNLYYKRLGTIVTHYIDYDTQEPVADDLIEKGRIGKDYKAEPIDVDGYILYESPEVTDLTFTRDPQEFTFIYRKRASITVRYVDKDTDEDITDPVNDNDGWDGKKYTCEELKLKGYKLVSSPKEEDCHYSVDGNTVIFYYQKNKAVNPKTGDSNMLPLALAGVALGLVAALGTIKLIKRR
jgi:LPXTG-motif cell wall-anchored protein